MRIYPETFEVIKEFNDAIRDKKFEGRVADNGLNLVFLMSMVAGAGDGDHVEIGALFGASAISAALIKKKLGLGGDIYAIDPYDEETRVADVNANNSATIEQLCGNPQALKKNADAFGVKINLVQKPSDPWPKELEENTFVTAYIDGDHLRDMPHKDFLNLSERVSDYIGFDNYEEGYPDVLGGVNKILSEDENWVLYYKNGSFLVLRRRLPPRGTQEAPATAL